jgi:hypothetical protein
MASFTAADDIQAPVRDRVGEPLQVNPRSNETCSRQVANHIFRLFADFNSEETSPFWMITVHL